MVILVLMKYTLKWEGPEGMIYEREKQRREKEDVANIKVG
jgi:hypothetical protein